PAALPLITGYRAPARLAAVSHAIAIVHRRTRTAHRRPASRSGPPPRSACRRRSSTPPRSAPGRRHRNDAHQPLTPAPLPARGERESGGSACHDRGTATRVIAAAFPLPACGERDRVRGLYATLSTRDIEA